MRDSTPRAWRAHVEAVFRLWAMPLGYTFADLRVISIPTMMLVGDCDGACTVEDAATTYRALPEAELCVLPRLHHAITAAVARHRARLPAAAP
ncbi:MAG TPA: hypothetical protein VGS80_15770 [Ktedonobacterales bacterium]|nr:hypothetical protein [Ktedonobacterales bacterium]